MRMAVLALLAALAFSTHGTSQPSGAWADKLFGNELAHDFGVVARGTQLKHSFKFTNLYKVPLEVTSIRVSCGCVSATSSVKILQPNESATLNVTMDARQFVGPKTVRVHVTVGPEFVSTATLVISANARGDVAFNPLDIDFGNVQRGQALSRFIDIESTGNADWRVTEIIKSASAPFDLRVEELPRAPGGPNRRGYRIHATLKSEMVNGAFKQEVQLKTNDPSTPTLSFPVHGTVANSLAVSPSPVVVSGMRVGESQTKKLIVRAQRPFRILGVEGQGQGITVDYDNRAEATMILTVHVQANQPGTLRRTLTIRTDHDNESAPLLVEGVVAP
jgi:hypothetical protein